jgi:hypothetical protein
VQVAFAMTHAALETYFDEQDIAWKRLNLMQYASLWQRWVAVFGNLFDKQARKRTANKARHEFSQVITDRFYVLCISDRQHVPYAGRTQSGFFAYECSLPRKQTMPDLSDFNQLEFVVTGDDFAWTMVHTHEDGSGGPFFSLAEWNTT